jgi:hypothetical protein
MWDSIWYVGLASVKQKKKLFSSRRASVTHTHWLVVELEDKDKDEVNKR